MALCRVCLVGDIRLLDLSRIYQETYHKLTNTELHTGTEYGMPSMVCYVCHRLLQRCHMFSEMARTSNRLLQDLLNNDNQKVQPQNVILNLKTVQTVHLSLGGLTAASSTPVVVKDKQMLEFKKEREKTTPEHEEIDIEETTPEHEEIDIEETPPEHEEIDIEEKTPEHEEIDIEETTPEHEEIDIEETTPEHEEIDIEEFKLESLIDVNINDDSNETDTVRENSGNDINNMHSCFICDVCNKIFNKRLNLVIHLKIHSRVKAYSCDRCDKRLNTTRDLKLHMQIHTGEKSYSCYRCNRTFITSSALTTHMRIHTGVKPYSCNICEKAFTQKGSLTTHMRIHTGEKPYSCDKCDKRYNTTRDFKLHIMQIHTGEWPYSCKGIRSKKWFNKSHANSHWRKAIFLQ